MEFMNITMRKVNYMCKVNEFFRKITERKFCIMIDIIFCHCQQLDLKHRRIYT